MTIVSPPTALAPARPPPAAKKVSELLDDGSQTTLRTSPVFSEVKVHKPRRTSMNCCIASVSQSVEEGEEREDVVLLLLEE